MKKNPFKAKESNESIIDASLSKKSFQVDGDILVSDSYRRHPKVNWSKFQNSKLVFYIGIIVFSFLIFKLYHLQIVEGAQYYSAAEGNRIRLVANYAPRGVIFDKNGKKLAHNTPDFALYVIPADLPDSQDEEDVILKEVANILNLDHFDIVQKFIDVPRTSFEPHEIARGLNQEQAILLESKLSNWQGLSLKPIQQRAYSQNISLSHVIGYTGKISSAEYENLKNTGYGLAEHTGKVGIEKEYETYLRGKPGIDLEEVDSRGKIIDISGAEEPVPGANLYLNIDSDLQNFIWDELKKTIDEYDSPGGSVVVMNPQNGNILSLVSYPGYDNNLFAQGIADKTYQSILNDPSKPLFNRAITGEYPSGSTFKMVVGTAGLEERIINRFFSINSVGGFEINGYNFPDWKFGGHGITNITKALAESVNTFFYIIGGGKDDFIGLGVKKIYEYGLKYGLTKKTGIDIPSESSGFLPTPEWKEEQTGERWFLGDTYHLSIGQGGILVTPIQVANYTAAVANGGTLYRPKILNSIELNEKREYSQTEILNKEVASKQSIDIIRQGLREAVTYGSARSLLSVSVPLAGKTGTAEFNKNKEPHAWFTGFGPYENPEIVVTVMIEQGVGGSTTATPIAKKVFEWYFDK